MNIYIEKENDIIHETNVDFTLRPCSDEIHLVQYDKSLPIIKVNLFVNRKPYKIDITDSASIRFGKRDLTSVYKQVLGISSDKTAVYFKIDEQMTTEAGSAKAALEIIRDDGKACASIIQFNIDRNPVQNEDIPSQSEFPILDELQEQVTRLETSVYKPKNIGLQLIKKYFDKSVDDTYYYVLRLVFYNFDSNDIGKYIYLFRTIRKGYKKGYKHPDNIIPTLMPHEGYISQMGYGVVATRKRNYTGVDMISPFPKVPAWMPNNGFIQTEWLLTAEDISRGYLDIEIFKDWVSLLYYKYDNITNKDYLSGVIGTGSPNGSSMKIKFGLVRIDDFSLQALSYNTLYFGSQPWINTGTELYIEKNNIKYLSSSNIYVSVK